MADQKVDYAVNILFEHEHLYYLPQFESIIHELKKRGEKNIYGSISSKVPQQEFDLFIKEMDRLEIELLFSNSESDRTKGLREMNFDIIFIGNKNTLLRIKGSRSFIVMIYHGIGLKQSYYNDFTNEMDLICVETESRMKRLQKGNLNAQVTGFSKLDLIDKTLTKNNIDKPTILYAPTFFPSSLQKTIPFLSELTEYELIIKLHHFYWTDPRYIRVRHELEEAIKTRGNIELCTFDTYNIINLYPKADVLISDISSTIFEYLYLNRPIIQTTYYTTRIKYKIFPFLLEKRIDRDRANQINFVFRCDRPELLMSSVEEAINNPERHLSERSNALQKFLGDTKINSADRVINAIESAGISIGQGP